MPDSNSIAIIGAGRIGSAFTYQLAKAGHDVTLIARPDSNRFTQLKRDGGIVTTAGERVAARISDRLDETNPYDVVFVTVLAHQVDAVLPALQRSKARIVIFAFATPESARLRAAIGASRVQFAYPGVLSTIDSDGKLNVTIQRAKAIFEDQRWVDVFLEAGVPARLDTDFAAKLRSRAPLTIAMESVTAMGMAEGRGARWAEARLGARGIRAAAKILRAAGDKPAATDRAPGLLLTAMLMWASRQPFREAVGNSDNEVRGLIDLYVAEARSIGGLEKQVTALEALRPGSPAITRASPGAV